VPITTAHVATGALLLGTALAFTVASLRIPLGRPGRRQAEAGAAASAGREAIAWK
jgi:hypothetical protein